MEKKLKKVPTNLFHHVKQVYSKWLEFEADNHLAINYIFAIIFANRWPVSPLWGYLIGPPGGTKTEILRTLQTDEFLSVSTLNPASLVSGYRDERANFEDPSLLPLLNNRVLIIKDFTSILSMYRDKREEVLAQLREAYDGALSKAFGNIGLKSYESKFGILAAVTPILDRHSGVIQQLGERFICFRMQEKERMKAIYKAVSNLPQLVKMRAELSNAAQQLLSLPIPKLDKMSFDKDTCSRLVYAAEFVSLARTQVLRSGIKRVISHIPEPELGTRLVQQFQALCMGHAAINQRTTFAEEDFELIRKVARDTIPTKIELFIEFLWRNYHRKRKKWPNNPGAWWTEIKELSEISGISFETVKEILEDFRLLKIVVRQGVGKYVWKLSRRMRTTIRLSGIYERKEK